MSPLKRRLVEDRAMRDAARAVITADIDLLKADVAEQGLASRSMEAGSDYVKLVSEGAWDVVSENRGKAGGILGVAVAGLAAWFFREEIAHAVSGFFEGLGDHVDEAADNDAMDDDMGEQSPTPAEHQAEHRS
jgi:hypothetical protein